MALKAEGIWPCIVLGAAFGEDDDPRRAGVLRVRINAQIDGGPDKGRFCTYEDDVSNKSAIHVMRSCEAVGWKGGPRGDDLNTLAADCDAWIKESGGKALLEVKHLLIKNGKRAGETWDKVNSIRRVARPLKQGSAEALADAREAMRRAREDMGGAPPADEYPPPAAPPAAPVSDDEIPF